MSKVNLSKKQLNELRRLTQKANRQIKQFDKAVRREGLKIAPAEPTGGIQVREQWETKKNPLSRSTKFESMKDFNKRMKFLKTFDSEVVRPKYTDYNINQQSKVIIAVETSFGEDIDPKMSKKIRSMGLGQINKFWQKFEEESRRLGMQYSSGDAMNRTIEFFKEDKEGLNSRVNK